MEVNLFILIEKQNVAGILMYFIDLMFSEKKHAKQAICETMLRNLRCRHLFYVQMAFWKFSEMGGVNT